MSAETPPSAAGHFGPERRTDLRLLGGGAVAAGDGGAGDAVLLQRLADRERAGGALDRPARRQDVGDEDDIGADHVAEDHAVGVWVGDVVEANFAAVVLERELVLHLLDLHRRAPLLRELI